MKKFLVILIIFSLMFSFTVAKEVTVVFEYPTEDDFIRSLNVSEDANTYSIIVQISDENNIPIDFKYYESVNGYFINAINNFYPDVNNSEYWSFFINGESSFEGISQYVPNENDELLFRIVSWNSSSEDPIEKDPIENAVNWLINNQKQSGEIGAHAVWGNAFSLMALSLFNDFNLTKQNAINYLLDNQKEDAGFAYPGFGSDAGHTAVSMLALISNDYTLYQFDKNNITSIDFLKSKQEIDGGFGGWGNSDNDTTAWSVMAFASINKQLPKKNNLDAIDFMIGTQNADGGFGYNASQNSVFDYTAEVLIALNAMDYSKNSIINNAINYLSSNIDENGCIGSVYDTALTSIAFNSYSEEFNNLNNCIVSKQLSDGGFARNNNESNSVDTAIAIIALKEKTFPVKILTSDSNNLIDSNALIAVGDTVEFILKIKNTGEVNAKNISISLGGINPDFIKEEISDLFISEIKIGEEKTARIFVEMKEVGDFGVTANILGVGIAGTKSSNIAECIVKEAQLEMNFGVAS